jgi:transcriptional regulator with XRE-family HTH domain
MVNKEAFAKRLQNLMEFYDVSSAGLADKIGVQRSSISHLLSGRNNPSLDFILKILDNFPEISFDWLVKGVGNLETAPLHNSDTNHAPTLFEQATADENQKKSYTEVQNPPTSLKSKNKSIEKILLLYTDGSFEIYKG